MHISTLRADCRHSLRVRAKNASSVGADIQIGADPGLSLQYGRQLWLALPKFVASVPFLQRVRPSGDSCGCDVEKPSMAN
jgi:hypothetical protein